MKEILKDYLFFYILIYNFNIRYKLIIVIGFNICVFYMFKEKGNFFNLKVKFMLLV